MSTNLYTILQDHALAHPDAQALIHSLGADQSTSTSYAQLASMARCFAAMIHRHSGERPIVPLILGKSPQCVAAMIGAIGAGKAFACLNRKLRAPQVHAIVNQVRPALAITDLAGLFLIDPSDSPRWCILRDGQLLPQHQQIIQRMQSLAAVEFWPPEPPHDAHDPPQFDESPSRPGCCLFTSGSTGIPKGVLVSQSDLHARALAEIRCFELRPEDSLLSILPFSFDVGLNQLLSALVVGCTIVLLDSFLPADILRASAQHSISGISAVPTIWADMLAANLKFATSTAHAWLRYITISGGDLPLHQLNAISSLAPTVNIFKTYGQTETFRSTILMPDQFLAHRQSVGRPFGPARVYVIREDQTPCAPGEEGEIVHTGLGTMLGYLDGQDPENKLRPNPFVGADDRAPLAVFTGDLGYLDAHGFLYLAGRRDAMLKISGNRVYPAEIANQLLELEPVRDAHVVGVKAPDGQTVLFAFVVMPGTLDLPALRRSLAGRLPSYMLPQRIVPLPAIPRTASGKPDAPALVERAKDLLAGDSNANDA